MLAFGVFGSAVKNVEVAVKEVIFFKVAFCLSVCVWQIGKKRVVCRKKIVIIKIVNDVRDVIRKLRDCTKSTAEFWCFGSFNSAFLKLCVDCLLGFF